MISSSKDPSKWIFPKGGWELDETVEAAAVRETLEEAGAHAAIVRQIGWFGETAPACVFEARLVTLLDSWAEGERARAWMPISKAVSAPPAFAQRDATAQQLAPRRPARAGAELRLLANGRSRAASMILWPRRCAPCGTLITRERRRAATPATGDIGQPRGQRGINTTAHLTRESDQASIVPGATLPRDTRYVYAFAGLCGGAVGVSVPQCIPRGAAAH